MSKGRYTSSSGLTDERYLFNILESECNIRYCQINLWYCICRHVLMIMVVVVASATIRNIAWL